MKPDSPIVRYFDHNGSRLIIAEHSTECFIATEKPMFLNPDQLLEIEAVCRNIRRRIAGRG